MTGSMERAISETNRRRVIQEAYNVEHNITPTTIKKDIQEAIHGKETQEMASKFIKKKAKIGKKERLELISKLEIEMKEAARILDFERAAELRDIVIELKSE